MSEIADKLDEARALIEANGWTQGDYTDHLGCFCTLGAMSMVTGGDPDGDANKTSMYKRCVEFFVRANPVNLPACWNDAPERTQAEVIEAFRKAAALARSEAAAVGGR